LFDIDGPCGSVWRWRSPVHRCHAGVLACRQKNEEYPYLDQLL